MYEFLSSFPSAGTGMALQYTTGNTLNISLGLHSSKDYNAGSHLAPSRMNP